MKLTYKTTAHTTDQVPDSLSLKLKGQLTVVRPEEGGKTKSLICSSLHKNKTKTGAGKMAHNLT